MAWLRPSSSSGNDKTQIDGKGGISYDSHGQLVVCTNRNNRPRLLTFAPGANGNVAPISILKVAGCKGVALRFPRQRLRYIRKGDNGVCGRCYGVGDADPRNQRRPDGPD